MVYKDVIADTVDTELPDLIKELLARSEASSTILTLYRECNYQTNQHTE